MRCELCLEGVTLEENRVVWVPKELKENIFLLLGAIRRTLGVKMVGSPYLIKDNPETYAIDFKFR